MYCTNHGSVLHIYNTAHTCSNIYSYFVLLVYTCTCNVHCTQCGIINIRCGVGNI